MNVDQLNHILARELHRTPHDGTGIYQWEWSEDLFWPSYATGGRVEKVSEGGIVYFEKEYRRDRMSAKLRDQWVITKWCAPETLEHWEVNFPGAPYPGQGYRINTDWYNKPGVYPGLEDTNRFIWAIRKQGDKSPQVLRSEMEAEMERGEASRQRTVEDAVENEFGAFLNPKPGTRSGHVSMPYTALERKDAVSHG